MAVNQVAREDEELQSTAHHIRRKHTKSLHPIKKEGKRHKAWQDATHTVLRKRHRE